MLDPMTHPVVAQYFPATWRPADFLKYSPNSTLKNRSLEMWIF